MVLSESQSALELAEKLREKAFPLKTCELIQPNSTNKEMQPFSQTDTSSKIHNDSYSLQSIGIDSVKSLNPKLAKKIRQRYMAFWLMPFGLLAGLTFSKMTGLNTFSNIGLGSIGQPLISGLLGLLSGLIGSVVATASVNPEESIDISRLKKQSNDGRWLLILETQYEIDSLKKLINEVNPIEIVKLDSL